MSCSAGLISVGRAGATGVALALMPTGTCYIGTYCGSGAEPGLYAINGGARIGGKRPAIRPTATYKARVATAAFTLTPASRCAPESDIHSSIRNVHLTSIPAIAAL